MVAPGQKLGYYIECVCQEGKSMSEEGKWNYGHHRKNAERSHSLNSAESTRGKNCLLWHINCA